MVFLSSNRIDATKFIGVAYNCKPGDVRQFKPADEPDESECASAIVRRYKKG